MVVGNCAGNQEMVLPHLGIWPLSSLSASSLSYCVHSEHAESREISYTALKTHYMTFEGKGMAISLRFRRLSPEIPLVLLG
jgi:hypothetical protein